MTTERLNEMLRLEGRAFWEWFFDLNAAALLIPDYYVIYRQAEERASKWGTCACCELKAERRREPLLDNTKRKDCAPSNERLDDMGYKFFMLIRAEDFASARTLYQEIQQLVAEENALCTPTS